MFEILKESSLRIKTGLAMLGVLFLVGLLDNLFVTWLFLGVVMLFGVSEAMKLFGSERNLIYLVAGFTWIVAYFYPNPQDLVFLFIVLFASILSYKQTFDKKLFLPLLYPLVSFLFLFALYKAFGISSLLWLLAVVAGADIGAYFVGKSVGKRQFSPTSPKKTLEGVIGGILIAVFFGVLATLTTNYDILLIITISLLVAIASVFGDLFESYLKREAGVKDSGDILPGHGGILDRTDGYLFGGIVMFILLKLFA